MNTETPETDAILMESWMSINFPDNPIPAAFAKRLEMERDEARKLLEAESRDSTAIFEEMEQAIDQRDKYAGLLCEAMSYAYGWPDQGPTVSALISAFEALELTPANGPC